MQPHQQRVVNELGELRVKIDALSKFIDENDFFKSLEFDERVRMILQRRAMKEYAGILQQRIDAFA